MMVHASENSINMHHQDPSPQKKSTVGSQFQKMKIGQMKKKVQKEESQQEDNPF